MASGAGAPPQQTCRGAGSVRPRPAVNEHSAALGEYTVDKGEERVDPAQDSLCGYGNAGFLRRLVSCRLPACHVEAEVERSVGKPLAVVFQVVGAVHDCRYSVGDGVLRRTLVANEDRTTSLRVAP